MPANDERQSLHLRVPARIKQMVEAYAQLKGISNNAAATLLIEEGDRAEKRRKP